MANQVVWVDIPVLDLDRAIRFYSAVLGSPVQKQEYPGMAIGLLPDSDSDVSGCLFTKDGETAVRPRTAHLPQCSRATGCGRGRRRVERRKGRRPPAPDRPSRFPVHHPG